LEGCAARYVIRWAVPVAAGVPRNREAVSGAGKLIYFSATPCRCGAVPSTQSAGGVGPMATGAGRARLRDQVRSASCCSCGLLFLDCPTRGERAWNLEQFGSAACQITLPAWFQIGLGPSIPEDVALYSFSPSSRPICQCKRSTRAEAMYSRLRGAHAS
jgi:hypothetical protein